MLIGTAIAEAFKTGAIKSENCSYADFLSKKLVNPNSLDLTLSNIFCKWDKKNSKYTKTVLKGDKPLILKPNESILGVTEQFIGTTTTKYKDKYLVPCIEGKSTMARNFLAVHVTAGFGDVGYTGAWTLELVNLSNDVIYLRPKMPICQIYFHLSEGELIHTYEEGSYNNNSQNFSIEKMLPKKNLHSLNQHE